jgi:large subunit ribosomal protein L24
MKLKVGDKVKISAGKDKGKTGKIIQVFVTEGKVVVEGLNLLIKHQRPHRQGEGGQRIQFPAPLAVSNVVIICPKCGQSGRVGYKLIVDETGKKKSIKRRVCGKCKEEI